MRILFWIISLICLPAFIFGQTIPLKKGLESVNISDKVYVFSDSSGKAGIEVVSNREFANHFRKSEQQILNFGFSDCYYYWLKFSIDNPQKENYILEIAQALLFDVTFYWQDTLGNWQKEKAGLSQQVYQRKNKQHRQVFSLSPLSKSFFVRMEVRGGVPIPVYIHKEDVYLKESTKQKITYGIYLGLMLFVILNNLFHFFVFRRFVYLHYSFLVFLYATFSAFLDGYIVYLLPGLDVWAWYIINPIFNQPVALAYALFFLETKKYSKRTYYFGLIPLLYLSSYIIWHWFIPADMVLPLTQFHSLIVMIGIMIIGIRIGLKGNRLGYYLAGAYFMFDIWVIMELVYLQTGSPAYFIGISHVSLGFIVEVIMLAFILSKRFEWEKSEMQKAKENAQKDLLLKTLENERMVREQNIILEQEVSKRTEKIKEQNEEIKTQNEELKSQSEYLTILNAEILEHKKVIESKHKTLTDSVSYAKLIQKSALPPENIIKMILPQHFIFFKPCSVVSGDFYYIKQIRQYTIVCAIDCTGHGIPGAFLSMLVIPLINEIVIHNIHVKANEVLDELRNKIKIYLNQTGLYGERQEGMDIAFCSINIETLTMSYAGAHNPLWLFRQVPQKINGKKHSDVEFIEFPADRQSVSIGFKEKPFREHIIQLEAGDVFYIFTDGYFSQFEKESGETFKSRRFRALLHDIQPLPLENQKEMLETVFDDWKGEMQQIDDVLVIGVRV